MNRICLALPTDRPCGEAISALGEEAAYAADRFGVEVLLLVLDSCPPREYAKHAAVVRALPPHPSVVAHHLDEAAQRDFLKRAIEETRTQAPEVLLDLMLPDAVSYGACTNRAFLIAAGLGCTSVHRRDSDSRYQKRDGETLFPVHHELLSIGKPVAQAAAAVTSTDPVTGGSDRAVALVGASFIGELSVDLGEMHALAPEIYREVVGLWAPPHRTERERDELVAESFRGAGNTPFTEDRSVLTVVDPMRVDMCNIAFHGVHEHVPLPPCTDTIGSDYFLIHLVQKSGLPGVLHNRHIENFHTAERRTDAGFTAYQTRFAKFLLSMHYLHPLYDAMARAGSGLLDDGGRPRPDVIATLARACARLDPSDNHRRLDVLTAAYRRLGGRYAGIAAHLAGRQDVLLAQARRDMEDFALLTEAWRPLVRAARSSSPGLFA
ncbi:DUF6271 family protein [Streptomyces anulatus]|uniref:DUF6271 family protein n=1 Tax=Streptomyces anulatus TaxID=1892 RepID=UPI0036444828